MLVVGLMATQVRQQLVERNKAEQEQRGLPMVSAVLTTARLTAEHRGMSNTFLAAMQRWPTSSVPSAPRLTNRWPRWPREDRAGDTQRQGWRPGGGLAYRVEGRRRGREQQGLCGARQLWRHSALIEQQLALVEELLSSESLLLDDDPVSHAP